MTVTVLGVSVSDEEKYKLLSCAVINNRAMVISFQTTSSQFHTNTIQRCRYKVTCIVVDTAQID